MSKVNRLVREIQYNKVLHKILQKKQVPYTLIYGPSRSVKVIGAKIEAVITMEPLPEQQVRLIIVPVKTPVPIEETFDERLLTQKLYKYINVLEG